MPKLLRRVRIERIPSDDTDQWRLSVGSNMSLSARPFAETYPTEEAAAEALWSYVRHSWGDPVQVTYCGDAGSQED